MTFNEMLRKLRTDKGLTQEELAQKTGIGRSAIGMYESGNREPKFEVLETLADFFNVDMNTLLDKNSGTKAYYLNPEAAQLAQEIYDNPQYKILFDATKKLKPESIKEVMKFIDYQKAKEEGE